MQIVVELVIIQLGKYLKMVLNILFGSGVGSEYLKKGVRALLFELFNFV